MTVSAPVRLPPWLTPPTVIAPVGLAVSPTRRKPPAVVPLVPTLTLESSAWLTEKLPPPEPTPTVVPLAREVWSRSNDLA